MTDLTLLGSKIIQAEAERQAREVYNAQREAGLHTRHWEGNPEWWQGVMVQVHLRLLAQVDKRPESLDTLLRLGAEHDQRFQVVQVGAWWKHRVFGELVPELSYEDLPTAQAGAAEAKATWWRGVRALPWPRVVAEFQDATQGVVEFPPTSY